MLLGKPSSGGKMKKRVESVLRAGNNVKKPVSDRSTDILLQQLKEESRELAIGVLAAVETRSFHKDLAARVIKLLNKIDDEN